MEKADIITPKSNSPTNMESPQRGADMQFNFKRTFVLPVIPPEPEDELVVYIKRAELNQTKNYICEVFSNLIGEVLCVVFDEKTNPQNGSKYNGVRVTITRLKTDAAAQKLISQIRGTNAADAIKMFHSPLNKYWMVFEYKQKVRGDPRGFTNPNITGIVLPAENLNDSERITKLEEIVRSQEHRLIDCQKMVEKYNTIAMDYEFTQTQMWLKNVELQSQLNEYRNGTNVNKEKEGPTAEL